MVSGDVHLLLWGEAVSTVNKKKQFEVKGEVIRPHKCQKKTKHKTLVDKK